MQLQSQTPAQAPVQLVQVPPKPTCNPNNIFDGGTCRDTINAYNQALAQRQAQDLQLFVSHQKELASAQATAPLQQQIASQKVQIMNLQLEAKSQAVTASWNATRAYRDGLTQGVIIAFVLIAVGFGVRKMLKGFTISKKASAASA